MVLSKFSKYLKIVATNVTMSEIVTLSRKEMFDFYHEKSFPRWLTHHTSTAVTKNYALADGEGYDDQGNRAGMLLMGELFFPPNPSDRSILDIFDQENVMRDTYMIEGAEYQKSGKRGRIITKSTSWRPY